MKDRKRCGLWNRFVRVKRADWTGPSAHSILCSAHFLRSDFDRSLQHQLGFSKKPVLNDDAVPSVYASTHRKVATDASGTAIVTSSGDEPKPKSRKRKRSAALVKLSAHRTTTSTISSIESTVRGEESQPEEESQDFGTSGCTCTCVIHQSPPKHTMPRAVQTRQSMRSKGCTAKLKTRSASTQTKESLSDDAPIVLLDENMEG
ncbi:hypothetical protein LSAT2_014865 [Lamellibrachia satsuma]|nr:hypothetical protein LSAT2_014865 [Lamellibrachia satsuma]